jgi:excisionase family DNA binding protein
LDFTSRLRTETNMKITATVREACEMTGLGKTTLYEKIADGSLRSRAVGRRRLIEVESLRQLVEAA